MKQASYKGTHISDARVGFFSNPRVPLLWNYLARPSPPRTTVSIFTTRPAPATIK